MSDYVLAMYDVRGKQKYIYRCQHLKEIKGGSEVITDIFNDYLYDAAIKVRNYENGKDSNKESAIFNYKNCNDNGSRKFSFDNFAQRMSGKQYIGEIVYDGGGNFLVLYQNAEICRKVTSEFSKQVLIHTGTLKVICTFISNISPNNFNGPDGDYSRLYRKHRYHENQELFSVPCGTLPIVRVDPQTSMPLEHKLNDLPKGEDPFVSTDIWAKHKKFNEAKKEPGFQEKFLDNLVESKGEESLLAVIYIDGNSMGAKVQALNAGKKSYDECITNLRIFSDEIQHFFIENRKQDIYQAIQDSEKKRNKSTADKIGRLVIGSGDEITIICNARNALDVVKAYLDGLCQDKKNGKSAGLSSCAGISVFHSHAPFADAYRIAEACCESGKQYMKKKARENNKFREAWNNACLIDFHFNQGAIGTSLDQIRQDEGTEKFIHPWLYRISGADESVITDIAAEDKDVVTAQDAARMQNILFRFGRSNVKGLLESARRSGGALNMEIHRILAHMSAAERKRIDEEFLFENDMVKPEVRNLIIQMMPFYDIWFDYEIEKDAEVSE